MQTGPMVRMKPWRRAGVVAAVVMLALGAGAAAEEPADPWPDLAHQIFRDRPLHDGAKVIALDMPARAEDAAIVPVTFRSLLPAGDPRHVRAVTLVIDQNPSPVAAVFTFGDKAGITAVSTRVRVDTYTNVHVVAELSDGSLYVTKTFVKAAGGCSAPAGKDPRVAEAHRGEMRFRQFPAKGDAPREAQLMIRHPNNSGLQMDQITHLYIPAFFIDDLKIWQGDDLVLAMEGGISIAENPSLRFDYAPNGAAKFRARAADNQKHVYTGEWPASSGM